jgi:acetyl esterase/lipase
MRSPFDTAAQLVRRLFGTAGPFTRTFDVNGPHDVIAFFDLRYGDGDAALDLYRPARQVGALPIVMWIHGGGVLGDSKENITGYCKLIASQGFAVVAPRYTLRAEQRALAAAQLMSSLAYLEAQATRLRVDPTRIVLAGDSTGAQLAAQLAAAVTTPGYAKSLGVTPTVTREQLRGVVLACGPYDLQLLHAAASTASGPSP